jgi:tripartite-type tricarboxylate transporter receptor subunit TctC
VPGYEATSWYALYVPANTPADIVKKMNSDVAAMLSETVIKQKYLPLGILVASSTPQELAARNAAEVVRWAPIIKAAGVKGE